MGHHHQYHHPPILPVVVLELVRRMMMTPGCGAARSRRRQCRSRPTSSPHLHQRRRPRGPEETSTRVAGREGQGGVGWARQ